MCNLSVEKQRYSENYNAIDLTKFIMSMCVVAIHTDPLINCNNKPLIELYNSLVRYAVPFFFICSGFFLGKKLVCSDGMRTEYNLIPLISYLKKIITLYVSCTILYLPLTIIGFWRWNDSVITGFAKFIRNFLFVGENYNSWSLWYLLATIYALIFVYVLLKRNRSIESISCIGFVIVFTKMVISKLWGNNETLPEIFELLQKTFNLVMLDGRIFNGLFYIPIGIYFAVKQHLSIKYGIILFSIGYILRYYPESLISGLALIVSSVGLFSIIANISLPHFAIYRLLRGISTDVYILHLMVWSIYYMLVYGEKTFGLDCFFFTTVFSVAASIGITFVKRRRSMH